MMIRVSLQLGASLVAVATLAPIVQAQAQESKPATVAEATAILDLSTFPVMADAKIGGARRLATLGYIAKGTPRASYDFQKKSLEAKGWKELPGGYLSDMSCSGTFGKDGYTVVVSAGPAYGDDAAGKSMIQVNQLGNIDLTKLPVPPNCKSLYSFPTTTAYVTDAPVKETAEALKKLFTEAGWEPYGTAGDSLFFKKNAIRVTAWPSTAPAQGGKTMIQLSSELLSADLPAPANAVRAAYADTTKELSIDVKMTDKELLAFYRDALGKAGWKPTTDQPVKIDFREMVIFRNDAKDIATLKMQKVGDILRATLNHETSAEFEEGMKRAEAAEAKRKAATAQRQQMAKEKAAKEKILVKIAVPADAQDVERKSDHIEFKLTSGKAKGSVEAIRDDLFKQGWKKDVAALEGPAGTIILSKKPNASVTITYTDTGFRDAEVTIDISHAEIAK